MSLGIIDNVDLGKHPFLQEQSDDTIYEVICVQYLKMFWASITFYLVILSILFGKSQSFVNTS